MLSNKDIFEYFIEYVKKHTIEEIIEEFGGGNIYIPSYKSTFRDAQIFKLYKQGVSVKELKKQFNLSESRIRSIVKKQLSMEKN